MGELGSSLSLFLLLLSMHVEHLLYSSPVVDTGHLMEDGAMNLLVRSFVAAKEKRELQWILEELGGSEHHTVETPHVLL